MPASHPERRQASTVRRYGWRIEPARGLRPALAVEPPSPVAPPSPARVDGTPGRDGGTITEGPKPLTLPEPSCEHGVQPRPEAAPPVDRA
ncbi:hypothetical protein GCM10007172_10630 [Sinomonas atrocyanea]|nr:hypothetical protein GCM10007172_10630 [Sinomonas atrocyanea]